MSHCSRGWCRRNKQGVTRTNVISRYTPPFRVHDDGVDGNRRTAGVPTVYPVPLSFPLRIPDVGVEITWGTVCVPTTSIAVYHVLRTVPPHFRDCGVGGARRTTQRTSAPTLVHHVSRSARVVSFVAVKPRRSDRWSSCGDYLLVGVHLLSPSRQGVSTPP